MIRCQEDVVCEEELKLPGFFSLDGVREQGDRSFPPPRAHREKIQPEASQRRPAEGPEANAQAASREILSSQNGKECFSRRWCSTVTVPGGDGGSPRPPNCAGSGPK